MDLRIAQENLLSTKANDVFSPETIECSGLLASKKVIDQKVILTVQLFPAEFYKQDYCEQLDLLSAAVGSSIARPTIREPFEVVVNMKMRSQVEGVKAKLMQLYLFPPFLIAASEQGLVEYNFKAVVDLQHKVLIDLIPNGVKAQRRDRKNN